MVILLLSLVAVIAVRAESEYLLWMIDDDVEVADGAMARIRVSGSKDTYLNLYDNPGEASFGTSVLASSAQLLPFYAGVGGYESAEFVLELYSSDSLIAQMNIGTRAQLSGYITSGTFSIANSLIDLQPLTVSPAPEPTSGMMLLAGLASLLLRRRCRS